MTTLPDFPKFADVDSPVAGQHWDKWIRRFENLLVALSLNAPEHAGRKKSLLLLYAGDRVFDIFENLTLPEPPADAEVVPDAYQICKRSPNKLFSPPQEL